MLEPIRIVVWKEAGVVRGIYAVLPVQVAVLDQDADAEDSLVISAWQPDDLLPIRAIDEPLRDRIADTMAWPEYKETTP